MFRISSVLFLAIMVILTIVALILPSGDARAFTPAAYTAAMMDDRYNGAPGVLDVYAGGEDYARSGGTNLSSTQFSMKPVPDSGAGKDSARRCLISSAWDSLLKQPGIGKLAFESFIIKHRLFVFTYTTSKTAAALRQDNGSLVMTPEATVYAAFDSLYNADWLPDGRLIMSASHGTGDPFHPAKTQKFPGLYITNYDLTDVERIPFPISPEEERRAAYSLDEALMGAPGFYAGEAASNNGRLMYPAVDRYGKRVAFILNGQLWTMKIDGNDIRLRTLGLVCGGNLKWSPNGKFISVTTYVFDGKEKPSKRTVIVPLDSEDPLDLSWTGL